MQNKPSPYRVAREAQSYSNMLYLLLSFPLGLCYFCVLVPGILLGIGTLVIWIWVPILLLLMSAWWGLAAFERRIAMRYLHVDIAPMSVASPVHVAWRSSLPARLNNRMAWKTLTFLLLKFPLGLCSFILTMVLLVLSLGLAIIGLVLVGISAPFFALFGALQNTPEPGRRLRRYLSFGLAGFGLTLLTFHLLNGLAFLTGQLARSLLGMSDTALRLDAAKTLAEQERLRAEQADQRRHELVVNVSHE
ncbi:MAG: sensor domain-containing protein, partial [Ktedonobacteraceae bacterium]